MIFKQCIDITDEMLRNHQKYVKDYYCRYCGIHEGEKIDIKNGIIEDKSFISENLSHACFHNCEFKNVDFKAANLDNALFSDALLKIVVLNIPIVMPQSLKNVILMRIQVFI